MSKQCTKCGQTKKLEEFHKKCDTKDGRAATCKSCVSSAKSRYYIENREAERARNRSYLEKNKEKVSKSRRERYVENREEIREKVKAYRSANVKKIKQHRREGYARNKEKIRADQSEYYKKNRDRLLVQMKEYRKENIEAVRRTDKAYKKKNAEAVRERMRRWQKKKKSVCPQYRLSCLLRGRLTKAISGNQKSGSAVRDLGCSVEELKRHLESKFNSRMNWKNWGTYWHIDHFFPLAEADLEDRVEFLAVNNWRNLQPLTAPANLKKSDTVLPEARELFEELKAEFSREAAA